MDSIETSSLSESHSSKWKSELFASTTLGSVHIAQAIQRSSDDGATLMFSKMNISDVGAAAAEELARIGKERPEDESRLKRITLGSNCLTTLPMEFALLSQLRYLNLKRNNFSVFPDVLTLMPSLDTLDISHNRIKKLPIEAGYLVHLRVENLFVLLCRVIDFCLQFPNLEVLQIERNPLEWPPKAVIEKTDSLESRNAMKDWVRSLQDWIEEDCRSKSNDDFGTEGEQDVQILVDNTWKFPLRKDKDFTPHNRSFSLDSGVSAWSTSDSYEPEITNHLQDDHPFHSRLNKFCTFSGDDSPTFVLGSSLPSPADSEVFDSHRISTSLGHVRNASYGNVSQSLTRSNLSEKTSMPDLKSMELESSSKTSTGLDVAPAGSSTNQEFSSHDLLDSILPRRKDSESSLNSYRVDRSMLEMSDKVRAQVSAPSQSSSYFRRLSDLPVSTALSQPLLCLIECARSILFAMGQVLQMLEYLAGHAIDDRISSVLRKVFDPATTSVTQLIDSLERFDAISRVSMPSPMVCRGVVESCRNTVAVFGKAVGVLALQLQVVACDNLRYSRWILLELYGATAELASAWETIIPHIEAIRHILHSKMSVSQQPPLFLHSFEGDVDSTSPASLALSSSDAFLGTLRTQPGVPRTARRHAGSFSSKDVEIGKTLPSYDDVPGLFGGVVSGTARTTPTPRAPKRQATLAITSYVSPSPTSSALSSVTPSFDGSIIGDSSRIHSRQSSQASIQTSVSLSPLVTTKAHSIDLQVDKGALHAVQTAVSIAPSVWGMIATLFDGDLNRKPLVYDVLKKARVVTARLAKTLEARQMHNFDVDFDRKDFREDARGFLKV
ncbi:hypothetical protein C0993_005206 [Termitomyces sp. T159_Od127]|nr:hypothetical protein C0993_005206 [Termitomyces sp. T159_Od127]